MRSAVADWPDRDPRCHWGRCTRCGLSVLGHHRELTLKCESRHPHERTHDERTIAAIVEASRKGCNGRWHDSETRSWEREIVSSKESQYLAASRCELPQPARNTRYRE